MYASRLLKANENATLKSHLTLFFGRTHTIGTGGIPIIETPFIALDIKKYPILVHRLWTLLIYYKPLVVNIINVSNGIFQNWQSKTRIISSFFAAFQNLKSLIRIPGSDRFLFYGLRSLKVLCTKVRGSLNLVMKILALFHFSPWFNDFTIRRGLSTENKLKSEDQSDFIASV